MEVGLPLEQQDAPLHCYFCVRVLLLRLRSAAYVVVGDGIGSWWWNYTVVLSRMVVVWMLPGKSRFSWERVLASMFQFLACGWLWEGLWQCQACCWKYLVVNPQVLPSLLGGSVRHSKAPPSSSSRCPPIMGILLVSMHTYWERRKTSLQYGDVWDQVRKVRQAKD